VLLVVHGATLGVDESTFDRWGLEALAVHGARRRPGPPGTGARRLLFEQIISRVATFPLPGAYGRMYGFASGLEEQLDAWHGTLIDPTESWTPQPGGDFEYVFSAAVQARLPFLRAQMAAARAPVFLALAPIPGSMSGAAAAASRPVVARTLTRDVGDATLLDTPASLPDVHFAQFTHLNANGRRVFTNELSAALSRRSQPVGAGG
jgi:hypothetical protein